MKKILTIIGLAAAAMLASSQAQITLYEIVSGPTTSESSTQNVHADVSSAGTLTKGAGINFNSSGSTFNVTAFDTTIADFDGAITANEIITWSFTLSSAYDLRDFSIRLDRSNTGPSEVRIDLDTGSGFTPVLTINSLDAAGANFLNVDLTAFTGVTTGTFRLSAYGASSAAGTFDFENTTAINSTNAASFQLRAIPEPTTVAFLLSGLAAMGLVRRRR